MKKVKKPYDSLPAVYSGTGPRSLEFWGKIKSLKGKDRDAAYAIGVMLQNFECSALQFINNKISDREE